jgi:hypothetical protein
MEVLQRSRPPSSRAWSGGLVMLGHEEPTGRAVPGARHLSTLNIAEASPKARPAHFILGSGLPGSRSPLVHGASSLISPFRTDGSGDSAAARRGSQAMGTLQMTTHSPLVLSRRALVARGEERSRSGLSPGLQPARREHRELPATRAIRRRAEPPAK